MGITTLHQRKHPRLENYDYSQRGCYFITICTNAKAKTLGEVVGRGFPDAPLCRLTDFGKCVDAAICYINDNTPKVAIEKYAIMPNHIHMLITVHGSGGASGKPRPTEAIIPKTISSLKRYTNRVCKVELWQDGYYDHIVRDENDYLVHWQYIDDNPAKWAEDVYYS